jgi:hypothetical protein
MANILDLLQQEITYVTDNNDFSGALECYNLVKGWLEKTNLAKANPAEYDQCNNYLIKLKFLCLNYFDDIDEYKEMLEKYFVLATEIPMFDLWDKLAPRLISISDLDARDKFKAGLREALERSGSFLVSRQKYNDAEIPYKVSEWIKDFIVNLGLDKFDKVKKAEYLANSRFIKLLKDEDNDKVKALLDIYEKLKISSRTPGGYENSVLMNIDGQDVVFNQGNVEVIAGTSSLKRMKIADEDADIDLINDATNPSLRELEETLKNFSPVSLEYKTISQEISRLKKKETKKIN